jgi:hypothetical protein
MDDDDVGAGGSEGAGDWDTANGMGDAAEEEDEVSAECALAVADGVDDDDANQELNISAEKEEGPCGLSL